MSSSPTPSSSASASTSSASIDGDPTSSTASSLYLYTFLATLVLLLGISTAVVLRSITIRLRQRRMIEEAIRNGTYVAPSLLAGLQPLVRPQMYDAYVEKGGEYDGSGNWVNWKPLSAIPELSHSAHRPLTHSDIQAILPPPLFSQLDMNLSRAKAYLHHLKKLLRHEQSDEPSSDLEAQPTSQDPTAFRIAVMIAMPSQDHKHDKMVTEGRDVVSSCEKEVPYVEFGLMNVPFDDHNQTAKPVV